jgi:hypothetical protein
VQDVIHSAAEIAQCAGLGEIYLAKINAVADFVDILRFPGTEIIQSAYLIAAL